MSKFLKGFLITLITCVLVFTFNVYAEGSTDSYSGLPDRITQFVKEMDTNGVKVNIEFTNDSAVKTGVYYDLKYDELKEQLYFELTTTFSDGYTIYDALNTSYIDGVKVNNDFLATSNVPYRIVVTDPTISYNVLIKTVYSDSMAGTLAKIQDGKANILDLFESPTMLFQTAYYALAAISLIISTVLAIRYKKYKSKSSNEIATTTVNAVSEAGAQTKAELVDTVSNIVVEKVVPIIEACLKSNQNVIKAVAVSNSKSKDAPLTVLDILNDNSKINISDIIDSLKKQVSEKLNLEETKHANVLGLVHSIVENIAEDTPKESNIKNIVEDQASIF